MAALSTGRAPMAAFEGMAASETSTWLTKLEKEGEKFGKSFVVPRPTTTTSTTAAAAAVCLGNHSRRRRRRYALQQIWTLSFPALGLAVCAVWT